MTPFRDGVLFLLGTLAAVALTLAVAGGLAALVPALRAARVDPATSLRAE